MIRTAAIVLAFAFGLAPSADALAQQGHAGHHDGAGTESSDAGSLTQGEIRKVDKEAKKVTIRHGPIRNLDMPAMTMVFRVADPAMLDRLKAGDRIEFVADKVGGAYTVMQVEVRK